MNLRDLLNDDAAVSPVIGVILMVAITVILAAVIGTFVLGLGDQVSSNAPQASFSFDYADGSAGSDVLTVTHDGGDSVPASQLTVSADTNFRTGDGNTTTSGPPAPEVTSRQLDKDTGVSSFTVSGEASAGTSFAITADDGDGLDDATVRVTWQASSGDSTATLAKWEGPDA